MASTEFGGRLEYVFTAYSSKGAVNTFRVDVNLGYGSSSATETAYTDGGGRRYAYGASGQKLRVAHYVAKPNITRTFGVKPSGSTQDEVLFAGQTDYLLGGSLVVKDGSIDKELLRQTRRIKMFWKVSNQSTRPLFPVPPFRHLLVSMPPRTSRRQHTGHNLSSSIQPVFPAWWRIIGPQPYGCQVEGNSCPDKSTRHRSAMPTRVS